MLESMHSMVPAPAYVRKHARKYA